MDSSFGEGRCEDTAARERDARLEAEISNRSNSDLISAISHEMRTPLNAIVGWVQILRSGRLGGDQAARALEVIERNARAQAQMMDDLLDMSRATSGRLRVELAPVDLTAAVTEAVEAARPAAESRSISLEMTVPDGPVYVDGDAARLKQIARHLLSNAIRFTPKGGQVDVRVALDDGHGFLTVTDTGQGLEPSEIDSVLAPFGQRALASRKQGGLGIGLPLALHLVNLHGGTIAATSDGPGRGATFTVRIPLRKREP